MKPQAKVLLVLIGILFIAIMWNQSIEGDRPVVAAPVVEQDASAIFACRDFKRAIEDTQSGLLNNNELREAVKKIQQNARLSSHENIRTSAAAMLREMTSGTVAGASAAFKAFATACNEL